MLTDEQIASEECRCLTAHAQFIGSGDVWIEGVNDFARAIESAACAPLLERIEELQKLSVTNIMLSISPCWDGMGEEVYAKSVADVEDKLGKMGEELEDWQLGIKRHPEMEERIAALEAKLAQRVPDVEDLKDRLVAISSAVADSDDRVAQGIIRTTLQLLSAAPAAPEQQEPEPLETPPRGGNICTDCANADSWGVPDKLVCQVCNRNSQWQPLNKSSKNPVAKAPNAQQAEAPPVGGTSLDELSGALMNNAPLNANQRGAIYALVVAAAQPKAVPLTDHAAFSLIDSMGWALDDAEKDDMLKLLRATEGVHGIGAPAEKRGK